MTLKVYVNSAIKDPKSSFCLAWTQEQRRWTLPTRAGEEGNTAPAHGCHSLELTVPHQSCLWRTNSALPTYFPFVKPQTCPSLPYITPTALRLCCKHVASISKRSNHEKPPWSPVIADHLSWEEIKSHLSSAPFFSMHFSLAQCKIIGKRAIY